MKTKRFAALALTLCLSGSGFSVFAQSTAQEMEALLARPEVTYAQAARFVLKAADRLAAANDEEAFRYAAQKLWLPKEAQSGEPAQLGGLSLLIMNAFDFDGGFMYTAAKNSHYAFRELQYKNIIQGRADPYTRVSGDYLVFIIGRALSEKEREEELAADKAKEREDGQKKDRLEPSSFDFGLLLTQDAAFYGKDKFNYRASAVPRVQFLPWESAFFITSLNLGVDYAGDEFAKTFEILRTEFSMRWNALGVRGGRITYADPSKITVDGLFDGLQLTHTSVLGRFGLGAFYTGALYKKNAAILMTDTDRAIYSAPLLKDDYLANYFAPRRVLAQADWEHPSLGEMLHLKAGLIAQFDLSNADSKYHSQYFTAGAGINFRDFSVTAGGSLEFAETTEADALQAAKPAAAGEIGFYFPLPSRLSSAVSLKARYGSGSGGQIFDAFVPVTTAFYGEIFQTGISGHTMVDLTYSVRFIETLGASLSASYFMRNNLLTPAAYIINEGGAEKKLLGLEIFSKLVWSPLSDLQFNLGAGAFLPPFGNVWPSAKAIWKIDLTTVFALY